MRLLRSGDVTATVQPVDASAPRPEHESAARPLTSRLPSRQHRAAPAWDMHLRRKAATRRGRYAAGVIIFNQGNDPGSTGLLVVTLGENSSRIPAIGVTYAVRPGAAAPGTDGAHQTTSSGRTAIRKTSSPRRRRRRPQRRRRAPRLGGRGPGHQRQRLGHGAILEIAEQMPTAKARNKVRFAFRAPRIEPGRLRTLRENLSPERARHDQGQPELRHGRLAELRTLRYDGDGSTRHDRPRAARADIEALFADYFTSWHSVGPTAFDGRSDYGPFIEGHPGGRPLHRRRGHQDA